MESLISVPIWYNKTLKTKFDSAGFNFIKDLFPENQPLVHFNGLRYIKIRKLRNIINNIPQGWINKIVSSLSNFITVIPCQRINLQGNERFFNEITSKQIYQKLIERKIKPLQV